MTTMIVYALGMIHGILLMWLLATLNEWAHKKRRDREAKE